MAKLSEIKEMQTETATPVDKIIGNIQVNRKLPYSNIMDSSYWRRDIPIAIVGGGPSLSETWEKLKDYRYVMVCGSAHDYLLGKGIVPTFCVVVDPDPITMRYMTAPDDYVTYLIASQCDPSVFEYLKEFNVYTWNAEGDRFENKEEVFGKDYKAVGGGVTVGSRAMVIAYGMGFHKQHLFGFDSCLTNQYKHHAYDFVDPEVETLGNIVEIKLGTPDSPTFKVAEYMLAQIFDFRNLLKEFPYTLDVTVFGGGPLAYIMDTSKANAKEVCKNGYCSGFDGAG